MGIQITKDDGQAAIEARARQIALTMPDEFPDGYALHVARQEAAEATFQGLINEARETQWTLIGTDEQPLEIRMAAALETQHNKGQEVELALAVRDRQLAAAERSNGILRGTLEWQRAVIAEALAQHGHADTCGSMLNEIYPCDCWRAVLSRSSKVAPELIQPWNDPECCVWVSDTEHFGGRRLAHGLGLQTRGHTEHLPRTREQYEAEEGK